MWDWTYCGGYDEIRENIQNLDIETLRILYAEWESRKKNGEMSEYKYKRALANAIKHDFKNDTLANYVYEKAEQQSWASNGGMYAYICPFQCFAHMVSTDRKKLDEE